MLPTVLLVLCFAIPAFSSSYDCDDYPIIGTDLQFTDPDPSNLEVKTEENLVSILCCAGNYDNITWYFEGQKFPNWNNSIDIILGNIQLAQDNQEVRISEVAERMEGTYKCVISNDTKTLEFTQKLWVKPKQTRTIELLQEKDCLDKSARIGDNVTFECHFYIGRSELCPTIIWYSLDSPVVQYYTFGYEDITVPFTNFTTFVVKKEECPEGDKTDIRTSLHIYNITNDAFGQYYVQLIREESLVHVLNLTKIIEDKTEPLPQVINEGSTVVALALGSTLVILFVFTLIYMIFKTDIHLFIKRRKLEKCSSDESSKFDAFISYSNSEEDRDFVICTLRPFLVEELSYNVCIDEINFLPGEDHCTVSVNAVNCSRCCILVLSPDYIKRQYCSIEFNKALEKHRLKKNIIPVMFRPISPDSLNRQEALQHLMKAGEVLKWSPSGTNKTFWKKLEVRMPTRRTPRHARPHDYHKNSKYIDRSTSTNSQTYLCPMRSVSKESASSYSFSEENSCQSEELFQQKFPIGVI
ncbi:interleukin-1 receptor accessory protein-like [Antedon mediterranea]|uniref:interleukin-1 receptor accessory protein-like n=1 Tax=Antedon mediterranea TaxID=105859 RepID=UPI003AF40F31